MPSKSQLRAQFAAITSTSDSVAGSYLEKYHWDLHRATNAFLEAAPKKPKRVQTSPALVSLFEKYSDNANPEVISVDGTLQYLADMQIDPEDARSLVLAYLLRSPETGVFPRASFLEYWAQAGISSVDEMAAHISSQSTAIFGDATQFEPFYNYCFDFVRGADTRIKTIASEEAVLYWQLLFGQRADFMPAESRLSQWYEFISTVERGVSKDLWSMFYKFVQTVIVPDTEALSGYDEMSSWPSLVDEYVEWLREKDLLN